MNSCTSCGRDNPVWFAPNDLWNRVMGGPDATDDPGGFLCPMCFIARAEQAGIVPTGWELRPERTADEYEWAVDHRRANGWANGVQQYVTEAEARRVLANCRIALDACVLVRRRVGPWEPVVEAVTEA